jgi:hypothetical protein
MPQRSIVFSRNLRICALKIQPILRVAGRITCSWDSRDLASIFVVFGNTEVA